MTKKEEVQYDDLYEQYGHEHDHDHNHDHDHHHHHHVHIPEGAVEYTAKVEGKKWEKAIDKAFNKKVKDVEVKGFRKGKVPRNIYEKEFGIESLLIDAADFAIADAYEEAVISKDIMPVVQPVVDLKDISKDFVEYSFYVIEKPEVKIKKHTGLKVKKDEVKVTKEEIKTELEFLLDKYTELMVKDSEIKEGDTAVINFEGFKDDVAFEGGKGEDYPLEIGSNTFIPGFEEQLIGLKAGDEKDVKVTFPEDYQVEELKNQPVVFKVKVLEVKEKVKRELDEDFFEDLALEGVNSKETLEKEIEENIKVRKESEVENKYIDDIIEAVSKHTEVEIPNAMIEEEQKRLLGRFSEQIQMQGISLDMYYQFTGTTEDIMLEQLKEEADKNVLFRLILEEVQNLEEIKITDKEVEKEAEELAKRYSMELDEFLQAFGGLDMIKYDLELRATIDKLKELNK